MILKIIALDFSNQENCQNLIDEYHRAGLIDNCLLVDLSDPQSWRSCYPDELETDLVTCLNRGLWTKMVLVSLRGMLNESHPSPSRVAAEVALRGFLQARYDKSVGLDCFTLSQTGTSVHESMFPANYLGNFIHQREIDVDSRQARIDVDDGNVDQVLVFTALTLVGAGKWVTDPKWQKVNDFEFGHDRKVRFVRVQTRVGVCGPLVANMVRAAVRPGGGSIPAGLPVGSFIALNEEQNELRKMSESFVQKFRLTAMPRELADNEKLIMAVALPWYKALAEFFKGFGRYLRSAVIAEWQDRVDTLTRPLLTKLQDITFGSDSSIIIRGVRHEISSDGLAKFAEELRSKLDGLDGVTPPSQTPDVWQGLLQSSFALLDGSDYPNSSIESPVPIHAPSSSGKRIVFMQPAVVGPDLANDLFILTLTDCEVLGLTVDRARTVGMFDHHEALRLQEEVKEAASRAKFRADVAIAKDREREKAAKEVEDAATTSRLRGALSRAARIEAAKADSESTTLPAAMKRTVGEIEAELDEWIKKRELVSQESFVAHLAMSLDNAIEKEVSSFKWDLLLKEIEELVKPIEPPKYRFKRILKIFGLLLIPLVIAAVLVSSVLGAITAIIGIPVLVFVLIVWGTSFAFALTVAVVKRALALRRLDFTKRAMATEVERKYRDLVHSINEFRRLQLLRVQFSDWQRFVREIAHYPYGRVEETGEVAEIINSAAIPPQFVVAKLEPSPSQAMDLRNFAHGQLKVSGYLGAIGVALRNDWQEEYESIEELRMQPNPELDVSAPELSPGVEVRGRQYLFARRDFINSSIKGNLRTEMVLDRVRELSENIHRRQVLEVFSTVDAGGNVAFGSDTPQEFLDRLTRQNRTSFSTDYFHPAKRGNDGVENLDEDFSFLTSENSSIGGFLVSGDDAQVVLGSTRVDIGLPFSPDRLRSYVENDSEITSGVHSSTDGPPV
jgi:hypothetical protein